MRSCVLVLIFLGAIVAACGSGGGGRRSGRRWPRPAKASSWSACRRRSSARPRRLLSHRREADGTVVGDRSSNFTPAPRPPSPKRSKSPAASARFVEVTAEVFAPPGFASSGPVLSRCDDAHRGGEQAPPSPSSRPTLRGVPGPNGAPIGPLVPSGLTCVGGSCLPPEVAETELEDFVADWPTIPPPDICRPAAGAARADPWYGQTDYRAADGWSDAAARTRFAGRPPHLDGRTHAQPVPVGLHHHRDLHRHRRSDGAGAARRRLHVRSRRGRLLQGVAGLRYRVDVWPRSRRPVDPRLPTETSSARR